MKKIIARWMDLSSPELARVAARDPVALLPVAAVEQHGPHLPLSTDVTIGEGIVETAMAELRRQGPEVDVLLMPPLMLGASLEHTRFPGTLSLSVEQAIAQLVAVGNGVARAGIRRLLIFNSHGGNRATIDAAALRLRTEFNLLAVKVSYYRFAVPSDLLGAEELAYGLHGGALETSLMLHLAPDKVHRDALADFTPLGATRARDGHTLGPEGETGFAWMAADLNPAGVAGNAAAANAATGARLAALFARRLADTVLETAAFDLALFDAARDHS